MYILLDLCVSRDVCVCCSSLDYNYNLFNRRDGKFYFQLSQQLVGTKILYVLIGDQKKKHHEILHINSYNLAEKITTPNQAIWKVKY